MNEASGRHILIVEDDPVLGGALSQRLRLESFRVCWAKTCQEALTALHRDVYDFILADIRLPDGSGEEMYRQAMPLLGKTPIVFATAFADIEQAVRLVRAGANDYLTKPYDVEVLVDRIQELVNSRESDPTSSSDSPSFGISEATAPLAANLRRLANRNLPILLRGETGTGKEVAARYLHGHSQPSSLPFVAVNCGAIPQELVESQFFGHERGAFTGAARRHIGYFEEAGEGVLFLDEIGELDSRLQTSLLRVLQERTFRRVGGAQDVEFQGRIIAATNADLQQLIKSGRFREDLYYRLAVVELTIPPLRARVGEVLPLARQFAKRAADRYALDADIEFSQSAVEALLNYEWPGNVRELLNRVERGVALTDSNMLDVLDLFPENRLDPSTPHSLTDARLQAELQYIENVLTQSGGRVGEAAKRLGISRTTLWKRRKQQRD